MTQTGGDVTSQVTESEADEWGEEEEEEKPALCCCGGLFTALCLLSSEDLSVWWREQWCALCMRAVDWKKVLVSEESKTFNELKSYL